MFTKWMCPRVLLIVGATFAATMPAGAAGYKKYTDYPEWEILQTRSVDGEDMEEKARFGRLIDRGEAAHEAMLAVLWQCDDWFYASGAMEMLHCSKGDKTQVWPELRRLLADRLPLAGGGPEDGKTACCRSIAKMLAENGGEDNVKALLPVLAHRNSLLRHEAAKYLGQYGNEAALEILETAKDGNYSPEVRQGFDNAINAIRSRLRAKTLQAGD